MRFAILPFCLCILPLSDGAQQQREPETPSVQETIAASICMFSGADLRAHRTMPAPDATCQGSACLYIYNVRHGTRCNSSDSVEADYANDSNALYLRGWVIFYTPNGKQYVPTDILKPGEKRESPGNAYVCHGSGEPSRIADTGSDPQTLKYPPKN